METQIKQLKLSATNIKGTLIRGNKELKKLRIREKNIFNRQRISEKRLQKESFVEGGIPGSGMVAGAARRMAAPAMSIIDKIKEFAGTLLFGILINNLPKLISKVENFLKENTWLFKTIGDVFKITGDLFMVLVDITLALNPKRAELEKERKELNEGLANLVGATNGLDAEATAADNAVNDYVGDVTKEELRQKTPEQVKTDVVTAIKEEGITKSDFFAIAKKYRAATKSNKVTQTPIVIPGVGTYERVLETTWGGGLFGNTKQIAKDTYGYEITPEEFENRYQSVHTNWQSIEGQLSSEGVQGYSKGGTVKPVTSSSKKSNQSFSGESATARKARESVQSFSKLENNTITNSRILEVQEDNNTKFQTLIENFINLNKKEDKPTKVKPISSPYTTNAPNAPGPVVPTPPGLPAVQVDPNEVIGILGSTGRSTGPHIHIEKVGGGVTKIPDNVKQNIMINGVDMITALYGPEDGNDGIGNYNWRKSQRNPTGYHAGEDYAGPAGQKITLKGGLKFKQFIPDQGDGYGNRVLIEAPNGAIYSLSHLNAGPNNINALVKKQQSKGRGTNIKPAQVIPLPPGVTLEPVVAPVNRKGYGRGGPDLTQTFDDSGGGGLVMIMAQQPVIVPGPTRYITRTVTQPMPVAVPITPKISGLRGLV